MCAAAQDYSGNRSLALTWRLFLHSMFSELQVKTGLSGVRSESQLNGISGLPFPDYCAAMRASLIEMISQYAMLRRSEAQREEKILVYLQEHFTRADLSLEQVGDVFGLSARSISTILQRATGMTFLQYVSSMRILYAKKLLAQTDRLIKDIALSVGYLDAASFTRKFRQAEGITPQEYRERLGT